MTPISRAGATRASETQGLGAEGVDRTASFGGGGVRSRAVSIGRLPVACACDRLRPLLTFA